MFFKILHQSKKRGSRARLGEIITSHGKVKTPAFVAVGTKGTVKSVSPTLLKEIGTQVAFVNTYHLVTHPGVDLIKKAGGIHQWANLNIPLMSDSGGFQVFSLARKKDSRVKFLSHESLTPTKSGSPRKRKNFPLSSQSMNDIDEKIPSFVKIGDDGVKFHSIFDGSIIEFTPEKSIEYQMKIGADMMMAFDECIPYRVSYEYTKEATERTHRWLERCIKQFKNSKFKALSSKQYQNSNYQNSKLFKKSFSLLGCKNLNNSNLTVLKQINSSSKFRISDLEFRVLKDQYLYGIIQGGMFEDLRKKSAEFVVSQEVDGVAIGGVSVGESKKEMRDEVKWVSDFLPKDKPVHLLGVGQVDDILDLVSYGIDTFDCVEPTRLARMGTLFKLKVQSAKFKVIWEKIDILKGKYRQDLSPVDEDCDCYVCQNFSKSYLHHLFKNRELLAYTLATYHNLWVMEKLFTYIRDLIKNDLI